MKDIAQMSQVEYHSLLNDIASVLRTQRRFIKIESEKRVDPAIVRYVVKKRGEFNRYLVVAMVLANHIIIHNRGLIV